MTKYKIEHTTSTEQEFIFALFDQSIAYQESKGYPAWKNYDKQALIADRENNNQYKVIVDSQAGIIFSVAYADKIIWREKDQGDAIYLHRIVVNPSCKGQRLFGHILNWAIEHATQKKLGFIRMDTWAANHVLIDYYKDYGFSFLGNYTTPDSSELPVHNRKLALALLELKL